jgi:hypothetical protein
MKNFNISSHFTYYELTNTKDHPDLLVENREWFSTEPYLSRLQHACEYLLENTRDDVDRPIIVTSGGRCQKLNKAVGGVPTSQHLFSRHLDGAFDFYVPGMNIADVAETIWFGGLNFYQMRVYTKWNFIHLGMPRPQNNMQVWWDTPDKPVWARRMRNENN